MMSEAPALTADLLQERPNYLESAVRVLREQFQLVFANRSERYRPNGKRKQSRNEGTQAQRVKRRRKLRQLKERRMRGGGHSGDWDEY